MTAIDAAIERVVMAHREAKSAQLAWCGTLDDDSTFAQSAEAARHMWGTEAEFTAASVSLREAAKGEG